MARASTMYELELLAYQTMDNGTGGDLQENNIEALIYAIKNGPDCREVFMMSDNLETPRDMSLLRYVNKPVRVILCGTANGINPAYLDIARATHGSVHTIESDITNLTTVQEGGTIKIDGQTFKLQRGRFVRVAKA